MTRHKIFVGNSVAGKSTLFKCITIAIQFKSEIFCGLVKLNKLDAKEQNRLIYLDTPG